MRTRLLRTPAGVVAAFALMAAGSLTAGANPAPAPQQEALPAALPAPTDPAPGSPVTGLIYSPDLETSPGGTAGYPRAVVL